MSIKSIKSIKSTKRQISDFLPLRYFYEYKNAAFLFLFACMRFVLFVRVKSSCKKKVKRFKNALIPSFTILLHEAHDGTKPTEFSTLLKYPKTENLNYLLVSHQYIWQHHQREKINAICLVEENSRIVLHNFKNFRILKYLECFSLNCKNYLVCYNKAL